MLLVTVDYRIRLLASLSSQTVGGLDYILMVAYWLFDSSCIQILENLFLTELLASVFSSTMMQFSVDEAILTVIDEMIIATII